MTTRFFGTDGIRGRAGTSLTPELALRAATGFARQLKPEGARRHTVAVAGDSRLSTPMLQAAVQSGLLLGDVEVVDLGVVPTPLVPFTVLRRRLSGGVMITASHNPVPDNGLKFFDAAGAKLPATTEGQIETIISADGWLEEAGRTSFGAISRLDIAPDYLKWLARLYGTKPGQRRLQIVLDCACGAAAELAPLAFSECGFEVTALNDRFDGSRVNVKSGTTDLAALGRVVRRNGADLGIGFDGDGDRMLAVDAAGRPVSGDRILALFATRLPRYRRQRGLVMTHMTNLGVEQTLARHGISLTRTDVGDAKVFAAMQDAGLNLGGEQSGHIIMRDRLPSGDGIAAGLQLARILASDRQSLTDLVAEFEEFPQQLTNLVVRDRQAWQSDRKLAERLKRVRQDFPLVRFYMRPSGTENLLRVLTEAREADECRGANAAVCAAIREWDAA